MASRTFRLIAGAVGLALCLALLATTAPAPAPSPSPDLAVYGALVEAAARASWAGQPAAHGERVAALVQLDMAPLALVGAEWSLEQRAVYAAELAEARAGLAAEVAALGGTVVAGFSRAGVGRAVPLDPADVAAVAALPGVAAVVRVGDYAVAQSEPPAVATQAELAALIGADEVWRRGNDGTGVEIAVIDSGLDYTHGKLGGPGDPAAYERAVCGVPGPGEAGCDPRFAPPADLFPTAKVRGGLDLVGDVWPAADPRCGIARVCPIVDPNPIDLSGHGTHVADIAAGLPAAPGGDDRGVAPGAGLWAFKACNGAAELCSGLALLSAIDAALDLDRSDSGGCAGPGCLAYDPADIIVLAVSFNYGQPEDAVSLFANLASFYGSLVVAAAGNDGDRPFVVGAPATAAGALAVAESALPVVMGGEAEGEAGEPGAGEMVEAIAADASRGPRINDSALKPDLAAPGAVLSARAGGGTAVAPFGGSSGAAPVAAGVAALVIQELEEKGALDPGPGLADVPGQPNLSLAPLVKAVLMNNAADLAAPGGGPAPLALQGAGRVRALNAFVGRTLALDATEMIALLGASPELNLCSVNPYLDLLAFRLVGRPPPCAALYPGGDPLYQAWNAQTGSVSFGYAPVIAEQELTRQVVVVNYSLSPRSYTLAAGLRDPEDEGRGVALRVAPERLELPGGGAQIVTMTVALSPSLLLERAPGGATCDTPAPQVACPELDLLEVEGALAIDGGPNNQIDVPVHILPRRVAAVAVSRPLETQLLLTNGSAHTAGEVSAFALVDISPNRCDRRGTVEPCPDLDYTPGDRPGSDESPVDIRYVGLRSYAEPGLNAALGLPPAPAGALADEVVEFAVTVYDRPYRASPNAPVQIEVHLDANADGATDYVATTMDRDDGRSMVFVRDVNPADGTRPTAPYLFTRAGFHTQSWVLPVPAAAVGLRSDRPFRFHVVARDGYFKGGATPPWDCSPGPIAACGAAPHAMQTGALRFRPLAATLTVPAAGRAALPFAEDDGGLAGSPSQLGLLLLYPDAAPGRGAEAVLLR